jgi:hypothetical protein
VKVSYTEHHVGTTASYLFESSCKINQSWVENLKQKDTQERWRGWRQLNEIGYTYNFLYQFAPYQKTGERLYCSCWSRTGLGEKPPREARICFQLHACVLILSCSFPGRQQPCLQFNRTNLQLWPTLLQSEQCS